MASKNAATESDPNVAEVAGPAVEPTGQRARAATSEKLWPISVFFLPEDTSPAVHIDWCANNIALALHRSLVQT